MAFRGLVTLLFGDESADPVDSSPLIVCLSLERPLSLARWYFLGKLADSDTQLGAAWLSESEPDAPIPSVIGHQGPREYLICFHHC